VDSHAQDNRIHRTWHHGKTRCQASHNAGYPLVVYNRTASKDQELVAMGARQVNSPKEVAENSEIIITMVADSPEVEVIPAWRGD
jgi:3-hydroxyisobutyrate dehydrogenase